jgi:hypothetical protein
MIHDGPAPDGQKSTKRGDFMRWLVGLLVVPAVLCCAPSAWAAVPDDPDDEPVIEERHADPDLERDDPAPFVRDPDDDRDDRREALPEPDPDMDRDRDLEADRPRDERRALPREESGGEDVALNALVGQLAEQQRQLKHMNTQLEAVVDVLRQNRVAPPARPAIDQEHTRIMQSIDRTLKALEKADTRIRNLEDQVWLTRIFGILGPIAALLVGLAF